MDCSHQGFGSEPTVIICSSWPEYEAFLCSNRFARAEFVFLGTTQ